MIACKAIMRAALLSSLLLFPLVATAENLTPAQSAYLKFESRKAEDAFVRKVARITNGSEALVRKALPAQGRITDPIPRLIESLERDLKRVLSDEQREAIRSADAEYRQALTQASVAASKK